MEMDERTSSIGPAGVMAMACKQRRPDATREAPAVIAVGGSTGNCCCCYENSLAPPMRLSPEGLRSLCSRGVPNDESNCASGDACLACRGRDPQDHCRQLAGRA